MSPRTWSPLLVVLFAAAILPGCPGEKKPAAPTAPVAAGPAVAPAPAKQALSAEAAALLDRVIAAAGGEENLKNFNQFTTLSEGTYTGMPYTATSTFIPGEMRMDVDMPDGSRMTMVMGLSHCWSLTGRVVVPCPETERQASRQQALFEEASRLLPLREGRFAVEATEVTLEGKTHPALTVSGGGLTGKGQLIFDPDSLLLARSTLESAMYGVPGTFINTFEKYEKYCGAMHPSYFSTSFEGKRFMDETITQLNCGPVDENLFIQPLQVKDGTTVEKTTAAATVACTTMKGPYEALGKSIGQLMGFLGQKDLAPMGAPIMIYQKGPPEAATPAAYVTEVCMPVGAPSPASPKEEGGFVIKALAPTKVLSIYGLGDYATKSGQFAQRLMDALEKRKLEPAGAMRQVTYMNPMDLPADRLVSEMQVPIR